MATVQFDRWFEIRFMKADWIDIPRLRYPRHGFEKVIISYVRTNNFIHLVFWCVLEYSRIIHLAINFLAIFCKYSQINLLPVCIKCVCTHTNTNCVCLFSCVSCASVFNSFDYYLRHLVLSDIRSYISSCWFTSDSTMFISVVNVHISSLTVRLWVRI